MTLLAKIVFSLICLGAGWLLVNRSEQIAKVGSFAHPSPVRLFWAACGVGWSISLVAAALTVWASWPVAVLLVLIVPVTVLTGVALGRTTFRTLHRRRH